VLLQPHERSSETLIDAERYVRIYELQPHERSSETQVYQTALTRKSTLQPHERSSETFGFTDYQIVFSGLQPHERSSETRSPREGPSKPERFNRTSVRLKLDPVPVGRTMTFRLQPHERSSETINCSSA